MTVPCNRPPTARGSSRLGEAPLLPAGLEHQGDSFLDELLDAAVFGRGDDAELARDRRVDVGADVLLALSGERCRPSGWRRGALQGVCKRVHPAHLFTRCT